MNVEGTVLNGTEPLLSREIFANVCDASKFVFYLLAFAAMVSILSDHDQRRRGQLEFGYESPRRF